MPNAVAVMTGRPVAFGIGIVEAPELGNLDLVIGVDDNLSVQPNRQVVRHFPEFCLALSHACRLSEVAPLTKSPQSR